MPFDPMWIQFTLRIFRVYSSEMFITLDFLHMRKYGDTHDACARLQPRPYKAGIAEDFRVPDRNIREIKGTNEQVKDVRSSPT